MNTRRITYLIDGLDELGLARKKSESIFSEGRRRMHSRKSRWPRQLKNHAEVRLHHAGRVSRNERRSSSPVEARARTSSWKIVGRFIVVLPVPPSDFQSILKSRAKIKRNDYLESDNINSDGAIGFLKGEVQPVASRTMWVKT